MRWNSWKTAILPTSWILAMVNLYSLLRLTCRWLRSFCWLCGGGCTWTTRCLVKGKSQIDTTKAPECYKWMQVPLVAVCKLVYLNIPYIYIHIYVQCMCAFYVPDIFTHELWQHPTQTYIYIYTRFNYALSVTWPEVKQQSSTIQMRAKQLFSDVSLIKSVWIAQAPEILYEHFSWASISSYPVGKHAVGNSCSAGSETL